MGINRVIKRNPYEWRMILYKETIKVGESLGHIEKDNIVHTKHLDNGSLVIWYGKDTKVPKEKL